MPPLTPPDEPIVYSPLHATLKKNRKSRLGELFFAGAQRGRERDCCLCV